LPDCRLCPVNAGAGQNVDKVSTTRQVSNNARGRALKTSPNVCSRKPLDGNSKCNTFKYSPRHPNVLQDSSYFSWRGYQQPIFSSSSQQLIFIRPHINLHLHPRRRATKMKPMSFGAPLATTSASNTTTRVLSIPTGVTDGVRIGTKLTPTWESSPDG
jgi:hypothetical protein